MRTGTVLHETDLERVKDAIRVLPIAIFLCLYLSAKPPKKAAKDLG
jgi:hypothetical protein